MIRDGRLEPPCAYTGSVKGQNICAPERCGSSVAGSRVIPWHRRSGYSGLFGTSVNSPCGRGSELKRRIWLTVLIATVGVAEIAFAVQIRTWHGRGSWTGDPSDKVFVASWLASELWINPWLLLVGVTTMVLAAVTFVLYPRLADRGWEP